MAVAAGLILACGGPALVSQGAESAVGQGMGEKGAGSGKPSGEHWAFVNSAGRLDGPRQEAMGIAPAVALDDAGNLYSGGRVIRVDGMVETVWGDNFNMTPLDMDEGPACFFSARLVGSTYWSSQGAMASMGSPLEGGDKGCLYLAANVVYKVWKNKDKQDRWWFKRVIGGGSAPLPVVGQSAPASGVKIDTPRVIKGHDGNVYIRTAGVYPDIFRYDEQKGDLKCTLGASEYRDKLDKNPQGTPAGVEHIVIGADGTIYLGCLMGPPGRPVYRISADRSKFEKIVHGVNMSLGWDGRAIGSGYFDGPIVAEYYPPDNLYMTSVDDSQLRRYKDGRVSTLCADGEWREFAKKNNCGNAMLPMYGYKGKDTDSAIIGRRFVLHKNYVYMLYFNGIGSHAIMRFGPYDFNKLTTGSLVEGR